MKRPAVLLTVLFVAIITSTALVSTAISGICRTFYHGESGKNVTVKSVSVDKQANDQFKQASLVSSN